MRYLLLLFCLLLVGCKSKEETMTNPAEFDALVTRSTLPYKAKIIESIGPNIYVVSFKVEGQETKFLYSWTRSYADGHISRSFTKL